MAIAGTEVVNVQAADGSGHPAAVTTPYTTLQLAQAGVTPAGVANALTGAGTTRADALALTGLVNNVTTAAASTGVVLPTMAIGQTVVVFNAGANPLVVYAPGSTTIDGTAGATGVALANAKRCAYVMVAAATVISYQLGAVSA